MATRFFASASKIYEYVSSPRSPGSPAGAESPVAKVPNAKSPMRAREVKQTVRVRQSRAGNGDLPNLLGKRRPVTTAVETHPCDDALACAIAARQAFLESQQRRAGRAMGGRFVM
ncbi:unnamed protein product [Symbiodinium natans]|uniref:Uncharacterized protein n=1 Tax=Symbiodinium natans TaxID=878477 RepID=A0A812RMQ3_9DINO|nr:unnamed protein product [Symbiodinium natans]